MTDPSDYAYHARIMDASRRALFAGVAVGVYLGFMAGLCIGAMHMQDKYENSRHNHDRRAEIQSRPSSEGDR